MISWLYGKVNSHFKTVLYTGLFSLALTSTSQAARVSVNNWQHCGKTVDIKTHLNNFNNNYLSATSDLGKLSVRTGKDGTTKFTIQCFTGDNKIALKTSRNRYVVAVGDAIKADRTRVGNWEKFEVHTGNSSGRFAFKSSHGKYMVAEPNRTVLADRTKIGSYESFILESGGSSTGGGGTTPPTSNSGSLSKSGALRIACYNVKVNTPFSGNQSNERSKAFGRIVKALNPDIWVFQETRGSLSTSGTRDAINKKLKSVTGDNWTTVVSGDVGLSVSMRSSNGSLQGDSISGSDNRSYGTRVTYKGKDIAIANTHLLPGSDADKKERHAKAMVDYLKKHGSRIKFACGDLNAGAGSKPYNVLKNYSGLNVHEFPKSLGGNGGNKDITYGHVIFPNRNSGDYTKWEYEKTNRIDFGFYDSQKLKLNKTFILNTLAMTDSELSKASLKRGDVINDSQQITAVNNKLKPSQYTKDSQKKNVYSHDHLPIVFDFDIK